MILIYLKLDFYYDYDTATVSQKTTTVEENDRKYISEFIDFSYFLIFIIKIFNIF